MQRNFIYGPGLPGYGTRGVDGSVGLTGLATYFSVYDGNSDTIIIKGKLISNKELLSNNVQLAGYPTRVYQTGDIFIDRNSRIFKIDFNETNLYIDTGAFLNTSGFFTSGPPQSANPKFQRYSNSFETEKFLIDTVYTNSVGNYTAYPVSIYKNSPLYYAKVNYIGNDVLPDLNGYYPFNVWSVDDPGTIVNKNASAIALVRNSDSNTWRFGNLDASGIIRDSSLYLDFKDIYCPCIAYQTIENQILFYNPVSGKISFGTSPGGMTMSNYSNDRIMTAGTANTNINAEANLLFNNSVLTLIGNLDSSNANSNIYFSGTGSHRIYTIDTTTVAPSDLIINTGARNSGGFSNAGNLRLYTGNGTPSSFGPSKAGDVSIYCGMGGASSVSGLGASGGCILIKAGKSGGSLNLSSTYATKGGIIKIIAGNGGDSASTYSSGSGLGGDIFITAGNAGNPAGSSISGEGGNVIINAGLQSSDTYQNDIILQDSGGNIIIGNTGNSAEGRILAGPSVPGSILSPTYSFNESLNSGFSYSAANRISVSITGLENFRFDVSSFHARGNIVSFSSSFSDIRLKDNIECIVNPLEKILNLRGVSYTLKATGDKHIGYIAQELEEVFPELVMETTMIGEPDTSLFKTIKYQELIPVLSESIKLQNKTIQKQQKQIDYLIEEIEKLKNK